jgi:hypothetical protein
MKHLLNLLAVLLLLSIAAVALGDAHNNGHKGLNREAKQELVQSGMTQYLGQFAPAVSSDAGDGWTRHTYAPNHFGDGPLCIAGTPYSVFTKAKDPKKLLVFMQGGGACWQNFYFCNILSEDQEPPPPPIGIWSDTSDFNLGDLENPLADYSVVYMPYCDGSVFTGDRDVVDPSFPFGPVRFHRGLENASAGVDMAKAMFPGARRIVVAGSSAGGVGASSFAPFLLRMVYGDTQQLSVINDAGPVAVNIDDVAGIAARASDWEFDKFFPASCTDCMAVGQQTAIIKWRLDNDSSIRESFYSTDGDSTDRFFLGIPTQEMYRELIVTEHGLLNAAHPDRYKRFIRSGSDVHTALQDPFLYYFGTANGVPLFEWIEDFLKPGARAHRENDDNGPDKNAWVDIVEDFVPLP